VAAKKMIDVGACIPHGKGHFLGEHVWAFQTLPAVNMLNVSGKDAAAVWPLTAITAATCVCCVEVAGMLEDCGQVERGCANTVRWSTHSRRLWSTDV